MPPTSPTPTPPDPNHNTSGFSTTWIISAVFGSILIIIGVAYLRCHSKKQGFGGLKRNYKK